jgi:hypothetical protein
VRRGFVEAESRPVEVVEAKPTVSISSKETAVEEACSASMPKMGSYYLDIFTFLSTHFERVGVGVLHG